MIYQNDWCNGVYFIIIYDFWYPINWITRFSAGEEFCALALETIIVFRFMCDVNVDINMIHCMQQIHFYGD